MGLSVTAVCHSIFFQAEDGIRDLVRSRGLGDVYKRQCRGFGVVAETVAELPEAGLAAHADRVAAFIAIALSLIHI